EADVRAGRVGAAEHEGRRRVLRGAVERRLPAVLDGVPVGVVLGVGLAGRDVGGGLVAHALEGDLVALVIGGAAVPRRSGAAAAVARGDVVGLLQAVRVLSVRRGLRLVLLPLRRIGARLHAGAADLRD